jgi:hypothetical protein
MEDFLFNSENIFEISTIQKKYNQFIPSSLMHFLKREKYHVGNHHNCISNSMVVWLLWSGYHSGNSANRESHSYNSGDSRDPGDPVLGTETPLEEIQ